MSAHLVDPAEVMKALEAMSAGAAEDRFAIDLSHIPAGMSYEWKRCSVRGVDDRVHMEAVHCYSWLVDKDGDPLAAYSEYEKAKNEEARLRERYALPSRETKRQAIDLAIKSPPAAIEIAGGIVALARQIEMYLTETD